jgi:hypothetical protein
MSWLKPFLRALAETLCMPETAAPGDRLLAAGAGPQGPCRCQPACTWLPLQRQDRQTVKMLKDPRYQVTSLQEPRSAPWRRRPTIS